MLQQLMLGWKKNSHKMTETRSCKVPAHFNDYNWSWVTNAF